MIDHLGTHQHLAVDLGLEVEPDGSLLLTTHAQRFYAGQGLSIRTVAVPAHRARGET